LIVKAIKERCTSALCHYFEPFYHGQGDERVFMFARERQDVIDREIKLCGYFIITLHAGAFAAAQK
jgi:hypothetical protein